MSSKIEYSIKIDNDLHVIHVQAHGILNFASAQDMSVKARAMASKYNYGIFYDFTDIVMDADISDIYKFTKENKALEDIDTRNVKAAFLISCQAQIDYWEFYELESRNCGLLNRVFIEDEENALKWASGVR